MEAVTADNVMFALGLVVSAAAFIALVFGTNHLLSPRRPTDEKLTPYECGMSQAGSPWASVNIRFSTLAVLFVLFDAEAIMLFAVAPTLKGSWVGLFAVAVFTGFLALGLMYAWAKGALQWRL